MPLEDPLAELNVGAGVGANSEATREAGAAPISLERRTMFDGGGGVGKVDSRGRGVVALRRRARCRS